MDIGEPFTIFWDPQIYAAFPSVVQAGNGDLLVAFRAAYDDRFLQEGGSIVSRQRHLSARSQILVQRISGDGHAVGAPAMIPIDLAAADQDATLSVVGPASLMLSSFSWLPVAEAVADRLRRSVGVVGTEPASHAAAVPWGCFTVISDDDGATWGPRTYVPPIPLAAEALPGRRGRLGGYTRGQTCRSNAGDLLLATYDQSAADPLGFGGHIYASTDGRSWQYRARLSTPTDGVGYCEPCLFACDDKTIVAYQRMTGARRGLAVSRSTDDGLSWSAPLDLQLPGYPCSIVRVPGMVGTALLFFAVRTAEGRGIHMSRIDAHGLPCSAPVTIRKGPLVADFGYPSVCALSDGRLLLVYYWNDDAGVRFIVGQFLRPDA